MVWKHDAGALDRTFFFDAALAFFALWEGRCSLWWQYRSVLKRCVRAERWHMWPLDITFHTHVSKVPGIRPGLSLERAHAPVSPNVLSHTEMTGYGIFNWFTWTLVPLGILRQRRWLWLGSTVSRTANYRPGTEVISLLRTSKCLGRVKCSHVTSKEARPEMKTHRKFRHFCWYRNECGHIADATWNEKGTSPKHSLWLFRMQASPEKVWKYLPYFRIIRERRNR